MTASITTAAEFEYRKKKQIKQLTDDRCRRIAAKLMEASTAKEQSAEKKLIGTIAWHGHCLWLLSWRRPI